MLTAWIARYGYAMVFASAVVEGDASLLTGAYLAHLGYLRLDLVMVVAAAATIVANQAYYWAGRRYGSGRLEALACHPFWSRLPGWLRRYSRPLVLVSRFVYGCRIAIPAACGATRMSPWAFALVDALGALMWVATVSLAGQILAFVLDNVVHEGIAAGILLVVGLLAVGRWCDRRAARRTKPEPDARGLRLR